MSRFPTRKASAHKPVLHDDAEPTYVSRSRYGPYCLLQDGESIGALKRFRRSMGWPTLSPVNASLRPSRVAAHDSGGGVVRYAFIAKDFHLIPPGNISPRHLFTSSRAGCPSGVSTP